MCAVNILSKNDCVSVVKFHRFTNLGCFKLCTVAHPSNSISVLASLSLSLAPSLTLPPSNTTNTPEKTFSSLTFFCGQIKPRHSFFFFFIFLLHNRSSSEIFLHSLFFYPARVLVWIKYEVGELLKKCVPDCADKDRIPPTGDSEPS